MTARFVSLLVWALVAAGAVAWGLRLTSRGQPVPGHAVTVAEGPAPLVSDLSRLLGTPPAAPAEPVAEAAPAAATRFQLLGLVAPRPGGHQGLALIAVDGKPAKPVLLGHEVESGLRLLQLEHRKALLGPAPGDVTVTLELPALPEPNRGVPGDGSAAAMAAGAGAPPAMPVIPGKPQAPAVGLPAAGAVPPPGGNLPAGAMRGRVPLSAQNVPAGVLPGARPSAMQEGVTPAEMGEVPQVETPSGGMQPPATFH